METEGNHCKTYLHAFCQFFKGYSFKVEEGGKGGTWFEYRILYGFPFMLSIVYFVQG